MTKRDPSTPTPASSMSVPRRRVLAGIAAAGIGSVAGCAGGGSNSIAPVSIDDDQACDQCGMIVADHPGTVGQVHFEDDEPEGGRPAQFCSATCTYT
ncbi:nitrous oxide reductase accessory protein NosL, partial [Halobellus sp. Atlit-38R]